MIASSSCCWNSKLIPLHLILFFFFRFIPPPVTPSPVWSTRRNFEMVIFASILLNKFYEPRIRITVITIDDNKLNLGLLVQRSATRTYTWITLLRLVVWQSSHREIKKLRRKRKRKEGICQAKNDGIRCLTRPDFPTNFTGNFSPSTTFSTIFQRKLRLLELWSTQLRSVVDSVRFPKPILKVLNAKQGYIFEIYEIVAIWPIPILWKVAPGKNPAKHTRIPRPFYIFPLSPCLHEGNNNACTVPYQAFHKFLPSLEVSPALFPGSTSI